MLESWLMAQIDGVHKAYKVVVKIIDIFAEVTEKLPF